MSVMVTHEMQLGAQLALVHLEALGKRFLDLDQLADVGSTIPDHPAAGALPEREDGASQKPRPGVSRDGHVVDVLGQQAGLIQAEAGGVGGKRGVVLDPREAFFLHGRDQLSVHHERGRSVAVVGVQAKNDHERPARLAISAQEAGMFTGTSICSKVTGCMGPCRRAQSDIRSSPDRRETGGESSKSRRTFSCDAKASTTSWRAGRGSIRLSTPSEPATSRASWRAGYG